MSLEFKIHIGDWSGDGHSEERVFLCTSEAASIECIRDVYFDVEREIGIDLTKVCGEYGELKMNEDHAGILWEHGIISPDKYLDIIGDDPDDITAKEMADIVIACLNYVNPDYNVRYYKPQATIPSLHFYGYDEKNRHINFIGYGVLGDY